MALVTIELRDLLSTDFVLFDFDYEVDDDWKDRLEQTITDFYYFYEIGQETPERFKHTFKRIMQTNMPTFNKLYGEIQELSIIATNQSQETYNRTLDTESENNIQTSETSNLKSTDYPQNVGITSSNADSESETNGSGKTDSAGNITTVESYTRQNQASNKGLNDIMEEFNVDVLTIEMKVIDALKPAFILVHN